MKEGLYQNTRERGKNTRIIKYDKRRKATIIERPLCKVTI